MNDETMARAVTIEGPHPVDRHVGRRVCERRISLGYNQSDLARSLGLTFQQIQKYEKGANRISASKLFEIATFFRVDIDYFFKGLEGDLHPSERIQDVQTDRPPTRTSLELSKLAPRLSTRQQKLALDLMKSMIAAKPQAEPV